MIWKKRKKEHDLKKCCKSFILGLLCKYDILEVEREEKMKKLIEELNKEMVTSVKFNPLEMTYIIVTKDENDIEKVHYVDENGKRVKNEKV